jgi:hypothetical protein
MSIMYNIVSWNDTSRYYRVLKVEVVWALVVVVVVAVVVVEEEVVKINLTLVAVGRGGDYLDTSSGSSSSSDYLGRSPARSLSCGQLTVL